MQPELSVILPTKDEEAVFETIGELRKLFGEDAEIIVVDKSNPEFHNKLKKTKVKLFLQRDNGVENAMIFGVKQSHGAVVVSLDADGTHDISGILKGMDLIKHGKAGLVIGNRMDGIQPGAMSAYLKLGNLMVSAIYNIMLRQHVHDVLSGLLIMDRKAVDKVKDIRTFEMPILFFQIEIAKAGFRVVEVPIKYYKRKYGESKLSRFKIVYGFKAAHRIISRAFAQ